MKLKAQAERYCSLIEQVESMERETFVVEVTAALMAVLHAAMDLPDLSATDEFVDEGLSDEEWRARFDAIEARLGDWSAYATTLSPFEEDATEVATPALADDLSDVWRDLKAGLLSLERGGDREDVLWEWRFGFYTHWGRHAVEALRVLHARLAESGGRLTQPESDD